MNSLFEFDNDSNDFVYEDTQSINRVKKLYFQGKPICIPYLGSKAKIVNELMEFLISQKPKAKYFIDLFGGGASVSVSALLSGFDVYYNELNVRIYSLLHYLIRHKPITNKDPRWLKFYTREEFFEFKNKETPKEEDEIALQAMVMQCYSFGNLAKTYAFNADLAEFKKQGHEFVVNLSKEACAFWQEHYKNSLDYIFPLMLERFKNLEIWQRRKIWANCVIKIEAIRVANLKDFYLSKNLSLQEFMNYQQIQMCKEIDYYRPDVEKSQLNKSNKLIQIRDLDRLEQLQQLQHLERLQNLERLENLQNFERLEGLQHLERLERMKQVETMDESSDLLKRLKTSNLDYRDAIRKIEREGIDLNDCLIYADPPYDEVEGVYIQVKAFDSDGFRDWLKEMRERNIDVYFSEYRGYGYKCIFEKAKMCTLSHKGNFENSTTGGGMERVFINKKDEN